MLFRQLLTKVSIDEATAGNRLFVNQAFRVVGESKDEIYAYVYTDGLKQDEPHLCTEKSARFDQPDRYFFPVRVMWRYSDQRYGNVIAACGCKHCRAGNLCAHIYVALRIAEKSAFHLSSLKLFDYDLLLEEKADLPEVGFLYESPFKTELKRAIVTEPPKPSAALETMLRTVVPQKGLIKHKLIEHEAKEDNAQVELHFMLTTSGLSYDECGKVAIELYSRKMGKSGKWLKPARLTITAEHFMPDNFAYRDRELLKLLMPFRTKQHYYELYCNKFEIINNEILYKYQSAEIGSNFYDLILPKLAATGRLLRNAYDISMPLIYDPSIFLETL